VLDAVNKLKIKESIPLDVKKVDKNDDKMTDHDNHYVLIIVKDENFEDYLFYKRQKVAVEIFCHN